MSVPAKHRCVVAYGKADAAHHEQQTNRALAQWLAQILGWSFADDWSQEGASTEAPYFVPAQTLVGEERVDLGVGGVEDLLGGYVQHAFIATYCHQGDLPSSAFPEPCPAEGLEPSICRAGT